MKNTYDKVAASVVAFLHFGLLRIDKKRYSKAEWSPMTSHIWSTMIQVVPLDRILQTPL